MSEQLTAELVVEAYQQTGLKPVQRKLCYLGSHACALGALSKWINPQWDLDDGVNPQLDDKFKGHNLYEFAMGFDENPFMSLAVRSSPDYREGQRCWSLVKDL